MTARSLDEMITETHGDGSAHIATCCLLLGFSVMLFSALFYDFATHFGLF